MARLAARHLTPPEGDAAASRVVVLAVGDVFSIRTRIDADLVGDRTAFAEFAEVTPELMDTLSPQVVVSSVLGRNFDCVDLAEKLAAVGFDGRYRLIAHGMPEPNLVLNEIRSLFPSLRVELDAETS